MAFQKLYSEEFQEMINLEEAERKGLMLIQFMAFIFQLSGADFPDDWRNEIRYTYYVFSILFN